MSMLKISIEEARRIADQYGLKACRVKGTGVVNIRKHTNSNTVDITWDEFEKELNKKKLALYKAEKSNFLKIMKE